MTFQVSMNCTNPVLVNQLISVPVGGFYTPLKIKTPQERTCVYSRSRKNENKFELFSQCLLLNYMYTVWSNFNVTIQYIQNLKP